MTEDLGIRLAEVFPSEGATLSGTGLLFAGEDDLQHDLPPVTWQQVAEHIGEVIDHSLIFSMMPSDFRYYLPGLILGISCHEHDAGSPMGSTIFADLLNYSNPRHWDTTFLERWCRFTQDQYEVLESVLPPLLIEHLGAFDSSIAVETLALARMQATDMATNRN